jgi:TolB-like protein
MRFRTLAYALVAATTVAGSAAGQDLRPEIAVLAFQDGGSYGQDPDDAAALERGISGMLVSELRLHPDSRLVDRGETQRQADSQGLAEGGRVNAATATNVGRMVGARYMVFGTFVDMYGKFRIDARIVDVETGEIVHVATGSDDRDGLFRIIQDIAQQILADLEFPPLPSEIEAVRTGRNIPTNSLMFYSRALLYQDRGDTALAAEFYRRALEAFPNYGEARQGLQGIEAS